MKVRSDAIFLSGLHYTFIKCLDSSILKKKLLMTTPLLLKWPETAIFRSTAKDVGMDC